MEQTERLFDTDSYMRVFEGVVVGCRACERGFAVVLDRTAFFPEEGGQSCDRGVLDGQHVLYVEIKGGIITHYVAEPIEEGKCVRGEIDWEMRFSNMQQHTGEHIVSGLIHERFGFENVGFHLGSSVVTLDFNGVFTETELSEIERSANEIITLNRRILVSFPSRDELKNLEYRSKKELTGQIRIVTVEGVDVCACCAPHVALTGEIGILKFVDAQHFRGGTRISMLCGFRALEDYRLKQSQQRQISVLLSSKPENNTETVERLKDECGSLKYKIVELQGRLLEMKLDILRAVLKEEKANDLMWSSEPILEAVGVKCVQGKMTAIFEDSVESLVMRNTVNSLTQQHRGFSVIFSGSDENGYSYIAGSADLDCTVLGSRLRESLGAKGGGKREMIQGSVKCDRAAIINCLADVCEGIK